ncbi:hypothetical protein EGQ24_06555 [bacterium]|nr:hypothetical protein [bacterium]
MKEQDFINIIKKQIGTEYIGDDCAFLKDLGIVVTQDSLVEDVHFKMSWCTPYQLGFKAVTVNISDVLASGAEPKYVTIALSLPSKTEKKFVEEFYKGAKSALRGAKIIGGDITGADKVYISIAAIGTTNGRKISSRSNAHVGDVVITKGEFGKSSLGLKELMTGGSDSELIRSHLEPQLEENFANEIATQINSEYAMMDTSDGLADALFQIASSSNVSIDSKFVEGIFGAEDYKLVATVPREFLKKLTEYEIIGKVVEKQDYILKVGNKKYYSYDELGLYNHFGKEEA